MKKSNFFVTQLLVLVLAIGVIGLGFNYFFSPFWNRSQPKSDPNELIPRQALEPAGNLKNGLAVELTLEQTISELLVLPILPNDTGEISPEVQTWLETNQPGFVQLRGEKASTRSAALKSLDFETAWKVTRSLKATASKFIWPSIILAGSGSSVSELKGGEFVTPPSMAALCENPDKEEPKLANFAAQVKQLDISIILGPVVDLNQSGGGTRALCSDLEQAIIGARKYIESFGAEGILPVVAHFPGVGRAVVDPTKQSQTLAVTVTELKPFQQLFKMYPNLGVLVSPLRVAEKFDNLPCSQSKACLANFPIEFPEVIVLADGVNGPGARIRAEKTTKTSSESAETILVSTNSAEITIAESARLSLLAGANILMFDPSITPDELTEMIKQLAEWSKTDQELNQAIKTSWQKVLKLRSGQNL